MKVSFVSLFDVCNIYICFVYTISEAKAMICLVKVCLYVLFLAHVRY